MTRLLDRLRTPFVALRGVAGNGDLRRVQLAYLGSEVGGWIGMIGLSAAAYADAGLTGFGVVFGLRMVPPMLAAPFMGVLADRLPRRRVMLASDTVNLVLTLAAAAIVLADGPLLPVYCLMSALSVVTTAFRPAQAALLPGLARTPDELTATNAVSSTIESVTTFAGPAIGGLLVAATDPGIAFLVMAAMYVWSASLLFGVREPAREGAEEAEPAQWSPRTILGELADGGRALVSGRGVALLVGLIGAQVVVSGVLFVLLAGLAFDVLGTGEDGYGWLLSGLGVGGLLGAVAALGLVGRNLVRSFAVGVVGWGVPIALLAVWQSPAAAFALVALVGLANTLVDVSAFTLLQRAVPDEVLARVFGILESVMYGSTVAGALLAPVLVSALGLETALVVSGLSLPVLVAATWPLLRSLDLAAPAAPDRLELLRGVPFLALLPEPTLEHLAGALEERHLAAGEAVVEQGETGDEFFLVAGGTVAVSVDGRPPREEGAGAYFGEIALLRDTPRTATVVARGDVALLVLGRDEFLSAVTGHVESAEAADAVVAARLGAYRPALLPV
jgi:MFS family permease